MDTDKVLISSRMSSSTNNSTVPTAEQILVPETLLKKRKSNEKSAAEAAAKRVELKKVTISHIPKCRMKQFASVMIRNNQTND